jgi:phage terminase small subunit
VSKDVTIQCDLTDKQRLFCDEYLIDLNATQAAIRAGYSPKTADQQASRLLTNVKVQEYIKGKQGKLADKLEITQERVLQEYAKVAFFDIRKIYTDLNSLKAIQDIDENSAAAIAGIEVTEESEYIDGTKVNTGYTKKIKVHNKISALEGLGRHLGLFNDKLKLDASEELMNLYKTVMKRAD